MHLQLQTPANLTHLPCKVPPASCVCQVSTATSVHVPYTPKQTKATAFIKDKHVSCQCYEAAVKTLTVCGQWLTLTYSNEHVVHLYIMPTCVQWSSVQQAAVWWCYFRHHPVKNKQSIPLKEQHMQEGR